MVHTQREFFRSDIIPQYQMVAKLGFANTIAAYYAKKTGITINIYNEEESVVTMLRFPE